MLTAEGVYSRHVVESEADKNRGMSLQILSFSCIFLDTRKPPERRAVTCQR